MAFFSTSITVPAGGIPLLSSIPGLKRVTQLQVTLRDLGATSTYVAVGGPNSQDRRISVVGEGISIDTPLGKRYLDISSLFISSDSATAVVEIIGDTYV